ncbi:uncharacterized protein FFFS_15749 [Fusarium fujikuroi]|nr:uncharacterized protein FFFS_15749 [Fusarium fujikuroi]
MLLNVYRHCLFQTIENSSARQRFLMLRLDGHIAIQIVAIRSSSPTLLLMGYHLQQQKPSYPRQQHQQQYQIDLHHCSILRSSHATHELRRHAFRAPNTDNSYAEAGSLVSGPSGFMGYGGDAVLNERPAQRRRIDDHPEYSLPLYGASASGHPIVSPGGLPPMSAQGYGAPSRQSSAAFSASGQRLPPLRAMEGRAPRPGIQEQSPRTGQWQPRVTETGWATKDTRRRP